MIAPDARAGGMGETGVATSPDVNSIHWNAAKLAFADKKFGLGISYTPWLRILVPDINLAYVSSYFKPDSISAIGVSMRYFSMGNIIVTDNLGNVIAQYRPNEYAVDACYSRKLSHCFSLGMTARLIRTNLANVIAVMGKDIRAESSFAMDLGAYYHDDERKSFRKKSMMMFGIAITNIGPKISYLDSTQKSFIPINLRCGQGEIIHLDSKNDLAFQYEVNKLLVPSPHQINFSMGMEYGFNQTFFARTGYFIETPVKNNRQFVTVGAGIKFNVFGMDFVYLLPANAQKNPLQNTLRFSLLFEFDKIKRKNSNHWKPPVPNL